jgi:universal stress protein A
MAMHRISGAKRMKIPRRILIATDFSEYSVEALNYAVLLAKHLEADLYLFHAFEALPYKVPETASAARPGAFEWLRTLKEEEEKKLNSLVGEVDQKGVKAHPIFKEGVPFREISKAAKEMEADLIVLGTHGRTGLDRLMMGSVAERVVRGAPCPILLVRPGALIKGERT